MRTDTNITQTERDAYTAFCLKHRILQDGSEAGVANANHIGNYVALTWGEDLTDATLQVALDKLKVQVTFISPQQAEVTEILSKLDQGQREIVATWLAKQHRLETDGDQGFSNVSVILAWLLNRRYAISDQGLTMALGNCQNTSHRKLYWKELPKADRSIGPGGKLNHFLVNPSPEGFMPRNQTNRTARQIAEDNRPKVDTPVAPVSVNAQYQAKAESLQGRTHRQTDQARKFFVMVPGTSTIDWQQTYLVREKFLNTQAPLIRR